MKMLMSALLLAGLSSFPAIGEITVNTTVPTSLIVDGATCPLLPPNLVVTGTGTLTFLVTFTLSRDGYHAAVHIHGNGKSTDNLGGQWTWSDADLFEPGLVNVSGDSFEATIREGFNLVGRGQKVMVHGVLHIKVVNGMVRVEFEKGNEAPENEPCEGFFF